MPRPTIAAQRQEQIYQAFEVCALRKGLDATTLSDVAEQAGLQRPLVRHFMGNRSDMVAGLIERMFNRTTQAVEQALAGAQEQGQGNAVALVLTQAFADPISNRLMIQLWQKSWQDPDLHAQLADVYQRCVQQIHDQLLVDDSTASYDLAYAIAALALGQAVFQQFNVQPQDNQSLLRAGQAIANLSTKSSGQRKIND